MRMSKKFSPGLILGLVFLTAAGLCRAQADHWVGTWEAPPQLVEPYNMPPAPGLTSNTLRQDVQVSIGGKLLRVRFSNVFGKSPVTINLAQIALSAGGSAIQTDTDKALTFHGKPSVTIPAGKSVLSDPCDFDLAPLSDVAVTIYFGQTSSAVTGHPGSRTTSYLQAGDKVSARALPDAAKPVHWYILDSIDVEAPKSSEAVVALGDSITDGKHSGIDKNGRWTDDLARRLQAHKSSAGVAVLNAGIGGNCVVHGGLGPTALSRFNRDVLAQDGVRWLIIFEGVNDIGTSSNADSAEVATNLIAAYKKFIQLAHAHHILVYGATITPFGKSFYDSPAHEAARETVNHWIRTSGAFDAVIDFDKVMRDPQHPNRLLPKADSGDHLHPNPLGYRMMAKAINLKLFRNWPMPKHWTAEQDHQNMMEQLGIKSLRPGANGWNSKAPNYENTDEARANPYPHLPNPLRLNDGRKVATPEMWWKERRPQIVEDFENDVYGHIPKNVPQVTWQVLSVTRTNYDAMPVITKHLIGHVDNSSYPLITVNIPLTLTTPATATGPVPVMLHFGFDWRRFFHGKKIPKMFAALNKPDWKRLVLSNGWGFAVIIPTDYQADNGAGLTRGIIGLCNQGQPRKPDQWGALRAWAWGASQALNYFETDPAVNAKEVGIEGLSRFGKAALVTMAFDRRFAIALIGSSGKGGAALFRRHFGEEVANLTSSAEYHWMAGNFLKYGGPLTAKDLPVDSHELIALCAPRPVFISYGAASGVPGAEGPWVDQRGSFMAAVAAQPVYRLLGVKAMGIHGNYLTAKMPPVNIALTSGALAWRQQDGGHTDAPNWPYFLKWADRYIHAPTLAKQPAAQAK